MKYITRLHVARIADMNDEKNRIFEGGQSEAFGLLLCG
jgi:hypothetical protein